MKRLLVCPVCKSIEIELDTGGYTGKYYCKNCGYIGSFILEMTEGEYKELLESEKFEKHFEVSKKPEEKKFD